MKLSNTALAIALLIGTNAHAFKISCVDENIQDSQITATFNVDGPNATVSLQIPTGETSAESASGACVPEEDSPHLSLRCREVKTKAGVTYVVRIDGKKATVARNGKIIAAIPCKP